MVMNRFLLIKNCTILQMSSAGSELISASCIFTMTGPIHIKHVSACAFRVMSLCWSSFLCAGNSLRSTDIWAKGVVIPNCSGAEATHLAFEGFSGRLTDTKVNPEHTLIPTITAQQPYLLAWTRHAKQARLILVFCMLQTRQRTWPSKLLSRNGS